MSKDEANHGCGVQGMFIPAICSFSTPSLLVLLSMLVWLSVLAAYWNLHKPDNSQEPLILKNKFE